MKVFFIIISLSLFLSCGKITTTDGESSHYGVPDGAKNDQTVEDDLSPGGGTVNSYKKMIEEFIKIYCKKKFTCDEGKDLRPHLGNSEGECVKMALEEFEEIGIGEECINFSSLKANQCLNCLKNLSCAQFFVEYEEDFDPDEYINPCPACDEVCEWDENDWDEEEWS